jgi:hypothetical protein
LAQVVRQKMIIIPIALGFLLWKQPCSADHLPANQIARGKSERILSGVDIQGRIRAAIAVCGPPTRVQERKVENAPPGAGGMTYVWKRPSIALEVWTLYYTDEKTGKRVESETFSVQVRGAKPFGKLGTTGAGLSLGSSLQRVVEVYGPRYVKYKPQGGPLKVVVQWKDETTLTIYFDDHQHINRMILEASIE